MDVEKVYIDRLAYIMQANQLSTGHAEQFGEILLELDNEIGDLRMKYGFLKDCISDIANQKKLSEIIDDEGCVEEGYDGIIDIARGCLENLDYIMPSLDYAKNKINDQ